MPRCCPRGQVWGQASHPPTRLGISSGLWGLEGNTNVPIQLQKDPPQKTDCLWCWQAGLLFTNCKAELNLFFLLAESQAGVASLCPVPLLFVIAKHKITVKMAAGKRFFF